MSTNITDDKYLEWIAALDHLSQIQSALYLHNSAKAAIADGIEEAGELLLSDDMVDKLIDRTIELTEVDKDLTAMLQERGLLDKFFAIQSEHFSMPEFDEVRDRQMTSMTSLLETMILAVENEEEEA